MQFPLRNIQIEQEMQKITKIVIDENILPVMYNTMGNVHRQHNDFLQLIFIVFDFFHL